MNGPATARNENRRELAAANGGAYCAQFRDGRPGVEIPAPAEAAFRDAAAETRNGGPVGATCRARRFWGAAQRSFNNSGDIFEGAVLAPFGQRSSRATARRGFTLLEMIVATAIAGAAVVGLLSLTLQALSNASHVRHYDQAAMRARTQMNRLLAMDPLPLMETLSGEFDENSGWRAVISPFYVTRGGAMGPVVIAEIDLEIWWEARGRKRTLDFQAYRRARPRRGDSLDELASRAEELQSRRREETAE